MEYSPKKIISNLDNNKFSFKKKFGQNFIVDENIINNIIKLTDIDLDTLVIEVGPGAGSLTYKLCEKAKNVLCYEIDNSLKEILDKNLSKYNNVEIKYEDFLKANVKEDLKNYDYKKLYLVSNLPYYITTPIITKIITDNIDISKIVVMVQKEVGDRFSAKVGSKDYNSLTVFLNYYFDIKKVLNVSKNVFIPKPNVDSVVVSLVKKDKKIDLKNEKLFFEIIRNSFTQKRKTLKNNLKNYNLINIENTLKKYNMDLSVRAEQISLDVFIDIANNYED